VGRRTAVSPVGNCREYQQPVLLAATAAAAVGLLGLGGAIGPSAHGAAARCLGGTGLTAGAAALAARAGTALAATAAGTSIAGAARRGLTTSQGGEGQGGPDEERGHEKAPWERTWKERKPLRHRRAMQGMETLGPASVPPHPVEHPQWAGMDRLHRAVALPPLLADVDRRRVEAMREDRRAGTDVGLGADRDRRRLVARGNVAAARIDLIQRRLAGDRFETGPGHGARAARLGSDCRVNVRPMAAAVRRRAGHSRLVNGGDARSQGRSDGRGTVVTTPGAGTAGTRGQEGGDDQGRSESEPRAWARSQKPQSTTSQPVTTMEPVSLRSTDRAQTHPEGEPQARIGSSRSHRNPPFPCRGRAPGKDAATNHLLSRVGIAATSRHRNVRLILRGA
jgi:hypothetical protein